MYLKHAIKYKPPIQYVYTELGQVSREKSCKIDPKDPLLLCLCTLSSNLHMSYSIRKHRTNKANSYSLAQA